MIEILVTCGNGGEYEYHVDVYRWVNWIEQNIQDCKHIQDFTIIRPHTEADKGIICFAKEEHAMIFSIIKPNYVNPNDIDWTAVGPHRDE